MTGRSGRLAVQLPVMYCPGCGSQLVNYLFVRVGTDVLLDIPCARREPAGTVAPIHDQGVGLLPDAAPVLDPQTAVELLLRLGAELAEGAA